MCRTDYFNDRLPRPAGASVQTRRGGGLPRIIVKLVHGVVKALTMASALLKCAL